jgi:hypothetical protein
MRPSVSGEKREVTLLPWIRLSFRSRSTCVLLANAFSDCSSSGRQRYISPAPIDIASHPRISVDPVQADRQPVELRSVRAIEKLPARFAVHRIRAPSLLLAACYAFL